MSSVCTIGWWLCPAKTIVIAIRGKKSSTFSRSHFFLIWLCANLVTPLCRNWIQYELVLLIYILNRLKNYIHIVMLHLESWRKIHDRCQYASAKYSYCRDVKKRYFKCQLTLDDFIFQLKELYVLLNENYVEDDDNMFRYWFVIRKKEKKSWTLFSFLSIFLNLSFQIKLQGTFLSVSLPLLWPGPYDFGYRA